MAVTALLITVVSALYGTAGQAGGSGFVAVMTLRDLPVDQIRPTAFALNIIAATYATWRVQQVKAVDWRMFARVTLAAVPAAFAGGFVLLTGPQYLCATASLLIVSAGLIIFRARPVREQPLSRKAAWLSRAGAGFASGMTGVGGGVFLSATLIIVAGICPKRTAALSPPFILVNSIAALAGILMRGQHLSPATVTLGCAALVGSVIGSAIGFRFMTARAIRIVLAAILLVGAGQMLFRASRSGPAHAERTDGNQTLQQPVQRNRS